MTQSHFNRDTIRKPNSFQNQVSEAARQYGESSDKACRTDNKANNVRATSQGVFAPKPERSGLAVVPATDGALLKSRLIISSLALLLGLSAPAYAQDNDVDAYDGTVLAGCTYTPVTGTPGLGTGRTGNNISRDAHCIGTASTNNAVNGDSNSLGEFNDNNLVGGSLNVIGNNLKPRPVFRGWVHGYVPKNSSQRKSALRKP